MVVYRHEGDENGTDRALDFICAGIITVMKRRKRKHVPSPEASPTTPSSPGSDVGTRKVDSSESSSSSFLNLDGRAVLEPEDDTLRFLFFVFGVGLGFGRDGPYSVLEKRRTKSLLLGIRLLEVNEP
jgi:hypothetical protein